MRQVKQYGTYMKTQTHPSFVEVLKTIGGLFVGLVFFIIMLFGLIGGLFMVILENKHKKINQ